MSRTAQYLARYAEAEVQLADRIVGTWSHGLVIPACNEGPLLLKLLEGLLETSHEGRLLAIVVINARENSSEAVHLQNEACELAIAQRFAKTECPNLYSAGTADILIVDKFREGARLAHKQGVGLARKIGSDILVALHHRGQLTTPMFGSTDADAILPQCYFKTIETHPCFAAISFPFQHVADTGFDEAMALYELSLHHYVLGLESAGSPYAYHTIGSTLAISFDAYVSSRGFPKRQAGEDFYLLNKVAKLGDIYRASGPPITLAGRPSDRVPFGTGPALRKIQSMTSSYSMYNPLVFTALGQILSAVEGEEKTPHSDILEKMGFSTLQKHLRDQVPPTHRKRHFHEWFDGFRTLKFIHHLRDQHYPNLHWKDAIRASQWGQESLREGPVETLNHLRSTSYPRICGSTPRPVRS